MKKIFTSTALALSLGLLPAVAHDFVLTSDTGADEQMTVSGLYGHPGTWEAPDIRRLIALDVYSADKEEPTSLLETVTVAKASALKLQASLEKSKNPGYTAVGAIYDNGYWVSAKGDKYYSTTKKEAAGRISVETSSHNMKFAKVLVGDEDQAIGHRLEIVLQKKSSELAAGAKLPVMVVFDGKALEGVEVAIVPLDGVLDHNTPGEKTDGKGMVEFPIAKTGKHVIRVSHGVPSAEPELADNDNFSATLVFEVASK